MPTAWCICYCNSVLCYSFVGTNYSNHQNTDWDSYWGSIFDWLLRHFHFIQLWNLCNWNSVFQWHRNDSLVSLLCCVPTTGLYLTSREVTCMWDTKIRYVEWPVTRVVGTGLQWPDKRLAGLPGCEYWWDKRLCSRCDAWIKHIFDNDLTSFLSLIFTGTFYIVTTHITERIINYRFPSLGELKKLTTTKQA